VTENKNVERAGKRTLPYRKTYKLRSRGGGGGRGGLQVTTVGRRRCGKKGKNLCRDGGHDSGREVQPGVNAFKRRRPRFINGMSRVAKLLPPSGFVGWWRYRRNTAWEEKVIRAGRKTVGGKREIVARGRQGKD